MRRAVASPLRSGHEIVPDQHCPYPILIGGWSGGGLPLRAIRRQTALPSSNALGADAPPLRHPPVAIGPVLSYRT